MIVKTDHDSLCVHSFEHNFNEVFLLENGSGLAKKVLADKLKINGLLKVESWADVVAFVLPPFVCGFDIR